MAITVSTSNIGKTVGGESINVFAVGNPSYISLTRTASEDYVQVALFEADGVTQIASFRPLAFPSSNVVSFDLAPMLQSVLSSTDDSPTTFNAAGYGPIGDKFKTFRIGYRTDTGTSYTVSGIRFFAVYSVLQISDTIGNTYGNVMASYVPSVTITNGVGIVLNQAGRWLTRFEKQYQWQYQRTDGTYGYWGNAWGLFIPYQADPSQTSDSYEVIIINQGQANVPTIDAQVGIHYAYFGIEGTPVGEIGEDTEIDVRLSGPFGFVEIIPTYIFRVRLACKNPYAIKWLNSLGAWEVWVFEGRSSRTQQTESTGAYIESYTNISGLRAVNRNLGYTARQLVDLQADNLTLNEIQALAEILTSPNVLLCISDVEDSVYDDWVSVTVADGDTAIWDTYNSKHKMRITIQLPETFTLSN